MAREGHAYAYTRFGGAELGMQTAERDARSARRGVWRSSREGGERPWEYRNRSRSEGGAMSKGGLIILLILLLLLVLAGLAVAGLEFAARWFG